MYDTLHKIWVPTTVVYVLPKESYQVHTSTSTVYHHTRQHLCECSVKPADTVPDATTTTLQAPARPHVSVPQPTPTKPTQPVQPTLVTPATPVTPKPQATAVPAIPAVQQVAPTPMPVTPSVGPMQPRRLGDTHVAPKCLIQEM